MWCMRDRSVLLITFSANIAQDRLTASAVQNGHKKYVLRKKPPGKVLASAHAVEREYQVCQLAQATLSAF